MTTHIIYGFCEDGPFLSYSDFLVGYVAAHNAVQVEFVINDSVASATQFEGIIEDTTASAVQVNLQERDWFAVQFEGRIDSEKFNATQFEAKIDDENFNALQFEGKIDDEKFNAAQFEAKIDEEKFNAIQFEGLISTINSNAAQAELVIEDISSYAVQSEFNIIEENSNALQFEGFIEDFKSSLASQSNLTIDTEKFSAIQSEFVIDDESFNASQFKCLIEDHVESSGIEFTPTKHYFTNCPPWLDVHEFLDTYAWLSGQCLRMSAQSQFIIDDFVFNGIQAAFIINDSTHSGAQFEGIIEDSTYNATQFSGTIIEQNNNAIQANFLQRNFLASQSEFIIDDSINSAIQFEGFLNKKTDTGVQFQGLIEDQLNSSGVEVTPTKHYFTNCPPWLDVHPFLDTYAWLSGQCLRMSAQFEGFINASTFLASQAEFVVNKENANAVQFLGIIDDTTHTGTQFEGIIEDETPIGTQSQLVIEKKNYYGVQFLGRIEAKTATAWQADFVKISPLAVQARFALYNTNNLRILCDFPSRGRKVPAGLNAWGYPTAEGQNWIASSTEAGDFSVFNVNTDIVEQYWRSATGVKIVNLRCDTEIAQGVFVDTFAILNHNISSSATILLEGSNVSDFSVIGTTINLLWKRENIYYIAPELPQNSYRYWRINIIDTTNPEPFIKIGTVVFGSAQIFQGECFIDRIVTGRRHFKDQVATEGFTNVSNDRALKRYTRLSFKNLDYNKRNYHVLQDIFSDVRTSQKCLWIPTPEYPERYAVFAKMADIPEESHNDRGAKADYIDLDINLDESL